MESSTILTEAASFITETASIPAPIYEQYHSYRRFHAKNRNYDISTANGEILHEIRL